MCLCFFLGTALITFASRWKASGYKTKMSLQSRYTVHKRYIIIIGTIWYPLISVLFIPTSGTPLIVLVNHPIKFLYHFHNYYFFIIFIIISFYVFSHLHYTSLYPLPTFSSYGFVKLSFVILFLVVPSFLGSYSWVPSSWSIPYWFQFS